MRSTKTKEQIFRDGFGLFTNGQIPDDIFNAYMADQDGEATFKLRCWVINNMRGEIIDWCTGIGIIEAVEHLYETALENGNISIESEILNKRIVNDSVCSCDNPEFVKDRFIGIIFCNKCTKDKDQNEY